jgi:hypothetical protein
MSNNNAAIKKKPAASKKKGKAANNNNNNKKKNTAAAAAVHPGQGEFMVPMQESYLATSASLAQADKKYQHVLVDDRLDVQALDYQKETMQAHSAILMEFFKLAKESSDRIPTSIELQLMAVKLQESWAVVIPATNNARRTTHQSNFNVADYRTKIIDTVLARRPPNHQLLGRGADMKVPIHNPALGEAAFITDDAVFGSAMDFSIL